MRQRYSNDCGPAALVTVMKYWGLSMSVGRARDLCGADEDGVTMDRLDHVARAAGMEVQALELNYAELAEIALPGIVPLGGRGAIRHYVVAWQLSEEGVLIWDPATGAGLVPPAEFVRRWSPTFVLRIGLPDRRKRTESTAEQPPTTSA